MKRNWKSVHFVSANGAVTPTVDAHGLVSGPRTYAERMAKAYNRGLYWKHGVLPKRAGKYVALSNSQWESLVGLR